MQSIKIRLLNYLDLVESNDREIARYEELEKNGAAKNELEKIKADIIANTEAEIAEKEYIKSAIFCLPSSIQQQLMTYRYIDKLSWRVITKILFFSQPDFNSNPDKYKRKTFRIHIRAIEYLEKTKSMQ